MRSVTIAIMAVSLTLGSGLAFAVPPAQPTPAMLTFLDNHAGAKVSFSKYGIGAVFGVPLASRGGEATTRAFVENFLITQGNVNILGARGVDGADLVYDNQLVISNGKFTVFTYTQKVTEETNLPLHGGFIKVLVLMGATEKIVFIGAG